MTEFVVSDDGTRIAFQRQGSGPALILVDGALCYRGQGPNDALASLLASRFTVYTYDRRGRGESGDTAPYTVDREIEDLRALVKETGETPFLYGISSGGALVLRAAASGLPVRRVAVYETPFADFSEHGAKRRAEYTENLTAALAQGRRGDAVELFLRLVEMPDEMIQGARRSPMWPGMEAVAPSLAYDNAVLGDGLVPRDELASITVPVLAVAGGASPEWLQEATRAVAEAVPEGSYRNLAGQTHMVDPDALAPVLADNFTP